MRRFRRQSLPCSSRWLTGKRHLAFTRLSRLLPQSQKAMYRCRRRINSGSSRISLSQFTKNNMPNLSSLIRNTPLNLFQSRRLKWKRLNLLVRRCTILKKWKRNAPANVSSLRPGISQCLSLWGLILLRRLRLVRQISIQQRPLLLLLQALSKRQLLRQQPLRQPHRCLVWPPVEHLVRR
ncbi:hypothetical protein D3C76_930470 [compost metagenome]